MTDTVQPTPGSKPAGANPAMTKGKLTASQKKDREKYKMEFDSKLENGPAEDRGCTDILCALIFFAFLVAWIVIFFFGVINGKPGQLLTPFDMFGNGCGYSPSFEGHKNIFFYDFAQLDLYAKDPSRDPTLLYKNTFCVDKCPESTYSKTITLSEAGIKCIDPASNFSTSAVAGKTCNQFNVYPTTIWLGRFCAPNIAAVDTTLSVVKSGMSSIYTQMENSQLLEKWANDVKLCWWIILISVFIVMFLAFCYMYLLKWCAGVITWLMLIGLGAVLIGGGLMCWNWAKSKQTEVDAVQNASGSSDTVATTQKLIILLKVFAYIFFITGGAMACFIICCYHRISLVIAIIKATAEFVAEVMSILLVPIINTFFAISFCALWIVGTIYLFAVGDLTKRGDFPIGQIQWNDNTRRAWYYNLFAILWILAFVLSLGNFIVGASTAQWYFNGGEAKAGIVRKSYYWAFRYHFGSIAFGSFILAVIWFIRIIFEYMYAQIANTKTVSQNKFIQVALNIVRCCLDCFERIVRFINKQAFIQVGLTGKSFCPAAKDGFSVVVFHPIEFALLSGLANLFMILGNAMLVGGTLLICFAIIRNVDSINSQISSPFWPLLLIGFIAYMISDLFSSVYMTSCYAILQCYFIDQELQSKGGKVARNCPDQLKAFFEKGDEFHAGDEEEK